MHPSELLDSELATRGQDRAQKLWSKCSAGHSAGVVVLNRKRPPNNRLLFPLPVCLHYASSASLGQTGEVGILFELRGAKGLVRGLSLDLVFDRTSAAHEH